MRNLDNDHHPHLLPLIWLIFVCVVAFALYVAADFGLLSSLVKSDQSKLSVAVFLLFALGCLHCAFRIITLSSYNEKLIEATDSVDSSDDFDFKEKKFHLTNNRHVPEGPVGQFLNDVYVHTMQAGNGYEPETDTRELADMFAANLKKSHEFGWYAVDILIKLGLLGTIIGFILMLGSIANTSQLDVNTMQKVLTQMSRGMGTALYTTLAGLVASILLGAQYLLADRAADALLERTTKFAYLNLIPAARADR